MKIFPVRRFLDLKATIAIFTVALFVSTIWVLAHYLEEEASVKIKKILAAEQYQTVEHIARSLDEAVSLRINALTDAALLIDPEWMSRPDRLHAFMATHSPLHRFFDVGMIAISREGIGLADLPNLEGREQASHAQTDYFREVMATGKPSVGKPIPDPFTHKPVLNIAVPIKNRRHEVIGVLLGSNQIVGGDLLSERLPKNPETNGDLHVISIKDGIVVSSTDPGRIMQPDREATAGGYRGFPEGSRMVMTSKGVEGLSSAKKVPSTGWLVVATLPASIALEPVRSLQQEIYKDAAIASAAIALLLWLFLDRQLSPLARWARVVDSMSDGREPVRPLPLEGSGEIRRLLGSFNKLQQHIETQQRSLRENEDQLRLAASVFEGTSEAVLISSPDNRIVSVNRAFCKMTGYGESELIGANPRLLQSGQHDRFFYEEMWSQLNATGQWQGEIWNRRKNGETYPERLTVSALYDANGKVLRYVAIAADITRQKQAEAVIWQQANYDLLTNLPNRRLLQERIREALEKARDGGLSVAVLHVDLDHFNEVNERLGHSCGDRMLIETGKRISSCVRTDADTVAHLGGDEFVVVLSTLADSASQAEQVAAKILQVVAEPFFIDNGTVFISASIGITRYPGDAESLAGLLINANQAKQVAKNEGRNRYCRFTASMRETAQTRLQLGSDMRGALAANQFEVYYQPIVDLATGCIVKAEALLRWHHPERGMVSPVEFIPVAEETGLISEIGDWVFREAAQMAKHWCNHCQFSVNGVCAAIGAIETGTQACPYQITVNKSPRQFFTGRTDQTWIAYLRENNIYPRCMTIEITEGLLLDRHPEIMEKLNAFRGAGIQVALDDFGTGYSAMSYLKKFDIDYLKIDRSFVRDIVTDPSDRAIVEAVIAMAHKLGMKVVAEGVESADQRDLLAEAGCDYGQGYFLAKPIPAAEFAALVCTPEGH
ncbi:MAG: signal transduction protein [Rhodocyclaceae bacterium]|nr:MAG: signal transduction protein [Rhodocyclaceae bacterium]TND01289.1 MAG: signal transduction protein [Rhodocyclaceae bacterium]